MIAGRTVSQGSGGCLFPVTERPTLRKIIKPAELAPGAPGTLAGLFATSVAPGESREDGRDERGHACRTLNEGADGVAHKRTKRIGHDAGSFEARLVFDKQDRAEGRGSALSGTP